MCVPLSDLKVQFNKELNHLYSERELKFLFQICAFELFGLSRIQLLTDEFVELEIKDDEKFKTVLNRLTKNEPYQYVFQKAEFRGLDFYVNENVLIPRPETEELVSLVLNEATEGDRILDLGTGSGCIPIAVKSELPKADVVALDVSAGAINVSKQNAENYNLDIKFLDRSMDESLADLGLFSVLVSNPPYIGIDEKEKLNSNVLDYEPHMALFSINEDPLYFYKHLELRAREILKNGGLFFMELHEDYALQCQNLFSSDVYLESTLINDMQGKQRFLRVVKK